MQLASDASRAILGKASRIKRHLSAFIGLNGDRVLDQDGTRLFPPAAASIRSITVGNGVANKLASNIRVKSILPDPSIVDQLLDGSLTLTGLLAGV